MTIWHEYNGLDRMFSDASRERTVQNTVYFCRYFWSTAHLFLLLALNTLRSLARVWFHKRNVGALHHSFIEQHVNILTPPPQLIWKYLKTSPFCSYRSLTESTRFCVLGNMKC